MPTHRPGGSQRIPRPPAWALGNALPWAVPTPMTVATVAATVANAESRLAQTPPTFPDSRPSAVLIALVDGDRGAEVLLTKRSVDLRNHAGEISFPGGRIDPGETTIAAALREAGEEVGLQRADATVAGRLSPLSTVVSRSYIMPIVATLRHRPMLVPQEAEVARILWVPLAELAEADTYREERWGTPPLDRRMHFFELDDETIWGATAHILRELLDVVYGPPATRTAL